MVIHMQMSTGNQLVKPEEEYDEEVLLSNWLPRPELGLDLQEAVPAKAPRPEPERDAETFLRDVYLSQE